MRCARQGQLSVSKFDSCSRNARGFSTNLKAGERRISHSNRFTDGSSRRLLSVSIRKSYVSAKWTIARAKLSASFRTSIRTKMLDINPSKRVTSIRSESTTPHTVNSSCQRGERGRRQSSSLSKSLGCLAPSQTLSSPTWSRANPIGIHPHNRIIPALGNR